MNSSRQSGDGTELRAKQQAEWRSLGRDDDLTLLLPENDVERPEVSILVPALDEELTVTEFVAWCKEGLARADVTGEILIVDSSTDRTAELALAEGARVLKTPKRGLGRAYIDAIPFIRGRYVIVGDADCTYDFRELGLFLEKLREGYEFVMGSRFRGSIERGAMPARHRYFGTPVTTFILNRVFSSHFSDIHCGMRGLTRDALVRMRLRSQGWEYASEMILKGLQLGLKITEVPIHFYKDRNGRISNVKRGGWLTPWRAGWDSLRVMFISGADFFLFRPGMLLSLIGLCAVAALSAGPVTIGSSQLTLHTQFLAVMITIIGATSVTMGITARVANDQLGHYTKRWLQRLSYNRCVVLSATMIVLGLIPDVLFAVSYAQHGFAVLPEQVRLSHLATTGLFLIVLGFLLFTFCLLIHAVAGRTLEATE